MSTPYFMLKYPNYSLKKTIPSLHSYSLDLSYIYSVLMRDASLYRYYNVLFSVHHYCNLCNGYSKLEVRESRSFSTRGDASMH